MNEQFHFYGLTIGVAADCAELVNEVRRDFAYFHCRTAPAGPVGFQIRLHARQPGYDSLPALPAAFITPRNICYRDSKISYIDYFGRGLAVLDRRAAACDIYCDEHDMAHEIAYLLILSTVGEHLDRRALTRVHALGLKYRGKAILILLPSGGGKSTIALELLRRPGYQLLGEDTPVIDRRGHVLPYPLRLGVRPDENPDIPPEHLRVMQRMEFAPKKLIDIEYFHDRLAETAEAGLVLIGRRNLGAVSEIRPASFRHALNALFKNAVVGLGIYQGMEFVLERGTGEVFGKTGVAFSRLRNCLALLRRAQSYRLTLGRDRELNIRVIDDFIREKLGPGE